MSLPDLRSGVPHLEPSDLPSSWILGVHVHRLTMEEAVAAVQDLLRTGGHHQVATVNATMLVRAARDADIRRVLNDATLRIPDGIGVLLAARLLGVPPYRRVPGIELVERLCAAGAAQQQTLYLIGAAPGVAAAAAARLRARYPGLRIAGTQHGYFTADGAVVEAVHAARPDLVLVALGFPRQEQWIARHRERLGTVNVGVGGSLDVLAGRLGRAPRWMQRAGLEWAYRVLREPRRWRSIAPLPLLVWYALRERAAEWGTRVRGRG